MTARSLSFLIIIASMLLGVGLVAPSLTLYPAAGEYTEAVKLFRPSFTDPREVSIAGGVVTLISGEDFLIGLVLLLFSVVFPMAKLGILWCAVRDLAGGVSQSHLLALVERLGKFSMLDVLVLALLVVAIKKLPGGTEVTLGVGAFAFSASVVITLFLPSLVRKRTS